MTETRAVNLVVTITDGAELCDKQLEEEQSFKSSRIPFRVCNCINLIAKDCQVSLFRNHTESQVHSLTIKLTPCNTFSGEKL